MNRQRRILAGCNRPNDTISAALSITICRLIHTEGEDGQTYQLYLIKVPPSSKMGSDAFLEAPSSTHLVDNFLTAI